eukprot:5197830-Amphidinium_carterae.1
MVRSENVESYTKLLKVSYPRQLLGCKRRCFYGPPPRHVKDRPHLHAKVADCLSKWVAMRNHSFTAEQVSRIQSHTHCNASSMSHDRHSQKSLVLIRVLKLLALCTTFINHMRFDQLAPADSLLGTIPDIQ